MIAVPTLMRIMRLNDAGSDAPLDASEEVLTERHTGLHDVRIHCLKKRPSIVRKRLPVRQDDRVITSPPTFAIVGEYSIKDLDGLRFVCDEEGDSKRSLVHIDRIWGGQH
jgi:hypothetical protein